MTTRPVAGPGGGTRRWRVAVIGGGALLVVIVVLVVFVVARSGRSDGARLAGSHSSASPSPTVSVSADVKPSASPKASHRATHEPPAHEPPQKISDKVGWSPFEQTYGTATSAASGSKSASKGITQVQASQSFGDYNGVAMVSVTADAQYFASASRARDQYDDACGGSSGKKTGSTKVADVGDKACSYVSDVSDGSSGSAILYVQVLWGNVVLRVAPMAFHNGAWSDSDLGTLRSASVRCAGKTVANL